ncbi:MAG TPA: molybdopterin cofactor-binding domain-containing protein [Streptosporangiaceae bacterium]|nr:molybdopterin cofactor-binding domain-containing protein [Streptosporangiaceae bacterium]
MTDIAAHHPQILGRRIRNIEWQDKTSGAAIYAGDVRLPGMLHAAICRSPLPHARILAIDTAAAERSAGVVAILTAADLPGRKYIHHGGPLADRAVLAVDVVRFAGEEVAAVAAETAEQARTATRRLRVRYRRLRAATTIAQARHHRAPRIHEHAAGNLALRFTHTFGSEPPGQAGDVSVTGRYSYPRQNQACMEPNTVVADWDRAAERLHLWVSTQAPYFVRLEVAHVLGLAQEQVVVHQVAVGGGFGSKSKISEHEAIAAALAMKAGRPVRLALAREEEFLATKSRHYFEIDLQTMATAGGKLTGRRAAVTVDNGAYNHSGPSVMGAGTGAIASLYRIPYVNFEASLVYTNRHPGGQFRGYGNPQVTFAIESQMDELADLLGTDPIELRLRNANQPGDVTHAGYRLESAGLTECLETARDAIEWPGKRRQLTGSGRGVGIAVAIQASGAYVYPGANRSSAGVEIGPGGDVLVRFGGADAGTGQRTVLAQIVAAELSIPVHSVRVLMMESDLTPTDLGAWSSRGTYMGGHAARNAAREAVRELRSRAAGLAGMAAGDIRIEGGRISGGDVSWDFAEFIALTGSVAVTGEYIAGTEEPDFRTGQGNISGAYSFAAHAVEVEVDHLTGKVQVRDYVAAHDSGRILNPLLAESQVIGGVAMGLGAALREELIYSGGRMVNPGYAYYPLPRAADVPVIRPIFVHTDDPNGPYGAKGIGEIAIVPVAAAVANAVAHAVGVRIRNVPLTPDKVLTGVLARENRRPRRYHLWRRPQRWQAEIVRRAYPLGFEAILDRLGTRLARRRPASEIHALRIPADIAAAAAALREPGTLPLSGGTDLLVAASQGVRYGDTAVDLTLLPELGHDAMTGDGIWRIGAEVRLASLEREDPDTTPFGVVAAAVRTIASPQIRQMATVAGNLCQQNRCWFYRNGFSCYQRGGPTCPCYAVRGDHRFYHAATGAHRCQAVTPSDLATVFTALGADVIAAGAGLPQRIPVAGFYRGPGETSLRQGEFLTAVEVPASAFGTVSAFEKLSLWAGDFAIVSACSSITTTAGRISAARVVVGALAPRPLRLRDVERALAGRTPPGRQQLMEIASAWTGRAHPLPGNRWKVDAAAGLVFKTLERCLG